MKVSVILTTHGEGKYLLQAIASVLAQTFQAWELLIARDGYNGTAYWPLHDERVTNQVIAVPDGVLSIS